MPFVTEPHKAGCIFTAGPLSGQQLVTPVLVVVVVLMVVVVLLLLVAAL